MEHPLETPHPSIQSQDQIFKLPSSQPRHSPNLSPLPIATTRSRNLKENRSSTLWTEHTSKTLTSGGRSTSVSSSNSSSSRKSKKLQIPIKKSLKANMKPKYSRPRNLELNSGSGKDVARALASPFVSRASSPVDGQGSDQNPKDLLSAKHRRGIRGLSDTFYNPNLPSSCSRSHNTEGLPGREKGMTYHTQSAHTSPSSKAPLYVLLDPNTQLKQKRSKGGHRGTASIDGTGALANYPQGLGSTTTQKKHEGHQRERRPSAPSSYSRRPRPHTLPSLIGAPVGLEGFKTRRSRLPSGLEIIHNVNTDGAASTGAGAFSIASSANNHIDAEGFVVPLLPDLHNKDPITNSAEFNMEMDWGLGIVDFNRPPSQMCHYPTTTMLNGWVGGDVFSSSGSESENEDDDDKGTKGTQTMVNPTHASRTRARTARPLTSGSRSAFDDPFGFGSVIPDLDQGVFGDDAWGISTPLKMQTRIQTRKEGKQNQAKKMMKATSTSDLRSKNNDGGLVRVKSLPVMHSMDVVGEGWMDLNDYDQENDAHEEDPDEQEQDMDLTDPLISANVDAGATSNTLGSPGVIQLADRRGDITPWILDSLISPPSRFLNTHAEFGREYLDRKVQDQSAGKLSTKTLSSSSSEHNLLSSPFQISDAYVYIQSQPEVTDSTTSASTAATTSLTAKRTRSGTIVPSYHRVSNNTDTNDPPGTRRTRSGTLMGPLHRPLAASGSDVQLIVGNENLSFRRTRGSPLPLPVGAGARRTRSGTIIGCAPPSIAVSAPASVSVPSGKSTKEIEPGPEILEDITTTSNSKSDRNDGYCFGYNNDENLNGSDIEVNRDGYVGFEPHIDALYIPRHSSSPDPIDFLRLAHFQDYDGMREKHYRFGSGSGFAIEEREDEDPDHGGTEERTEDEMVWCIADEPPSPVVVKNENKSGMIGRSYNKVGILNVGGGKYGCIGNGNNKRRRGKNAKGKGKTTKMRFMINGCEERPEVIVGSEEGEDSDDELLLGDGATL